MERLDFRYLKLSSTAGGGETPEEIDVDERDFLQICSSKKCSVIVCIYTRTNTQRHTHTQTMQFSCVSVFVLEICLLPGVNTYFLKSGKLLLQTLAADSTQTQLGISYTSS